MKTVILGGGSLEADFSLSYIKKEKPDALIAVDGGLKFCYETGLRPAAIVGDFDSITPEIIDFYRSEGIVPIDAYDSHKDYTDMEIGIRKAIEFGSDHVILMGATGTRLDHTMTNIHCLPLLSDLGIEAQIVDKNNRIRLLMGKTEIRKAQQFGTYVSFLPFGGDVQGLTLKGFAYPVEDFFLPYVNSRAVSNEIEAEVATVSYREGRLLMIESRD